MPISVHITDICANICADICADICEYLWISVNITDICAGGDFVFSQYL